MQNWSPTSLLSFIYTMNSITILLGVVLRLPALQLFEAEETHGDIWAVVWRGVDEASFGHLRTQTNTWLEKKLKKK